GNTIQGNYLGTDISGTVRSGGSYGVFIDGASGNTIGGTGTGARNLISGFTGRGIAISGGSGNVIAGNYIGTNATGCSALGNDVGVLLQGGATGNTIGGTTAAARNVISGNNEGVYINSGGNSGNVIQGNFIGTDATGAAAVANTIDGVFVLS